MTAARDLFTYTDGRIVLFIERESWMASLRALLVATVVAVSWVVVPAGPTTGVASAGVAAEPTAERRVGTYTPPAGVKINNPLRARENWTVNRHINKSIRSVPAGQAIRIFSWNFSSGQYLDNLLRAHRRGVTVRVIMAGNMARQQDRRTGYFWQLKRGLRVGNAVRPAATRSWARLCEGACRGPRGIPHTKLYLMSRAGQASNVVMVASANMTDASALNQWSDAYTMRDDQAVYDRFVTIFEEAARDRRAAAPYQVFSSAQHTVTILPARAATQTRRDPWLRALAPVRCTGAVNGNNGRTVIRVGQTAMLDARGVKLAQRIKQLHNRGCNIKLLTAELGKQVRDVLRSRTGRGPVPIRQLVIDRDGDGAFDKYIHTKLMSVRGVYGANPAAAVAFNGTANWTKLAMISDEVFIRVDNPNTATKYERFVNRSYSNMPKGAPVVARRTDGFDPFMHVEIH